MGRRVFGSRVSREWVVGLAEDDDNDDNNNNAVWLLVITI